MKNPKFLQIEFSPHEGKFSNLQYISDIANLLYANRNRLFDSFIGFNDKNKIEKTIELIQAYSPAFWAIVDPKTSELAGVVYLYDWLGDESLCYSTKVSTCFERKFWGKFAHRAGKLFIRHVFAKFHAMKICAEVYDKNPYPRSILENLGFKHEYTKPDATVTRTGVSDVLGYGLLNNHKPNRQNRCTKTH